MNEEMQQDIECLVHHAAKYDSCVLHHCFTVPSHCFSRPIPIKRILYLQAQPWPTDGT